MNHPSKILLAAAALVVGLSVTSAQASLRDTVRDTHGTIVQAESGGCVRSVWENTFDECAAMPAESKATILRQSRSVYFAFSKATLSADARRTLDVMAAEIIALGDRVAGVRIAGFADQMGDAGLNERLSKRRADAVRAYLVSKGAVNAQVVETRWFGESVPATQCDLKLPRAKRIKCLQPDRRVDVEVDVILPPPAK